MKPFDIFNFEPPEIERFTLDDLNNRKVVLKLARSHDGVVLTAVDPETGDMFILVHEVRT